MQFRKLLNFPRQFITVKMMVFNFSMCPDIMSPFFCPYFTLFSENDIIISEDYTAKGLLVLLKYCQCHKPVSIYISTLNYIIFTCTQTCVQIYIYTHNIVSGNVDSLECKMKKEKFNLF